MASPPSDAEIIAGCDRILAGDPRNAAAWGERGAAQMRLHRLGDAIQSLDTALMLDPGDFAARVRRGNIRLMQKDPARAIADYDRALAVDPGSAGVLYNRGTAFKNLKRIPEALDNYNRAMALEPGLPHLEGARMLARLEMCDWQDYEKDVAALLARVDEGGRAAIPFALLPLPASPQQILQCARSYAEAKFPPVMPLWNGEKYGHAKIRLAYLCGAFGEHPVAVVLQDVLAAHDRTRFEVIGVSYLPDDGGPTRKRVESLFDVFIDASGMDDDAVARRLRDMEIDIAIDLDGFTDMSRTAVIAQRPAPVQVNWLGYPSTMGAPYVDYMLGDAVVSPDAAAFQEKLVLMPDTFFPAESRTELPPPPARADCGLPETGFVFCAFNNNYKITPDVFDIWCRLLHAVDGSVLWLRQLNDAVKENLLREAAARGIAPERLVFAPTVPSRQENIARQQLADIFLDTLYYNAHSTACDALWAGLPVITWRGPHYAGRVAASLLHAIGIGEFAVDTLEDYEALALRLAQNASALKAAREKLWRNRDTAALFDNARFTAHLERACEMMHERQMKGLPPDNLALTPLPPASPTG